ncbi:hypothetical protein TRVL_03150 [Trypanosoma vivax]|nr:hypothetical protein TRVL_03150 [Trypanosoma vivax]
MRATIIIMNCGLLHKRGAVRMASVVPVHSLIPSHTRYSGSHSIRLFVYSPYDSIRKPPKSAAGHHTSCSASEPVSAGSSVTSSSGKRAGGVRFGKKDPEPWVFPETLKSGRYRHEVERERRYYAGPRARGSSGPDKRFYRKVEDFREVQDDDPYAGVFGERASVRQQRVKEWQRQFEEENADVELPYERTNVLARIAPNWFVRYFVNMRDRGGADSPKHIVLLAFILFGSLWIVGQLFYTTPGKARPVSELR